jgi:hypothetical protein
MAQMPGTPPALSKAIAEGAVMKNTKKKLAALKENALAWDMAQTLSALYAQRKPLAENDDARAKEEPAQVDWSRTGLAWGLAAA